MAPTLPKLCGAKRAVLCTIISIWAMIMLAIMGVLLSYKSLAFIEDLAVEGFVIKPDTMNALYKDQDEKYDMAAKNCFVALAMYGATFLISVYHWTVYHKRGLV